MKFTIMLSILVFLIYFIARRWVAYSSGLPKWLTAGSLFQNLPNNVFKYYCFDFHCNLFNNFIGSVSRMQAISNCFYNYQTLDNII